MSELLEQRAESGDVSAQKELGEKFLHGRGVAQDFTSAAKWYYQAALQNDWSAQTAISMMYQQGAGLRTDMAMAYIWARTALMNISEAHQKSPSAALQALKQDAMKNVDHLQAMLPPEALPGATETAVLMHQHLKTEQKPTANG